MASAPFFLSCSWKTLSNDTCAMVRSGPHFTTQTSIMGSKHQSKINSSSCPIPPASSTDWIFGNIGFSSFMIRSLLSRKSQGPNSSHGPSQLSPCKTWSLTSLPVLFSFPRNLPEVPRFLRPGSAKKPGEPFPKQLVHGYSKFDWRVCYHICMEILIQNTNPASKCMKKNNKFPFIKSWRSLQKV